MDARFNKFERVAGFFVLSSVLGSFLFVVSIAMKRGWFDSKTYYFTKLETAEGVRSGTPVEMGGIRVGAVDSLEIDEQNNIKARLSVLSKFSKRIRKDSRVQLMRPYVIGDKVLYVTVGSESEPQVAPEQWLPSEEIVGLTDLLTGRKLVPYIETMSGAFGEIKAIVDILLKQKSSGRTVRMIESVPVLVDRISALSNEMGKLGKQMTQDDRLGRTMTNLAALSENFAKDGPKMGEDLGKLVQNLSEMTEEFKKVLPAISAVAPDLPKSSRRLLEAIDEAVVVLKAMQKSFLLRGSAREVRDEEEKLEKERNSPRVPASSEEKSSEPK